MADIHWTNGTADNLWATAGNWAGGVPAVADNVFIGGRSSDNITGAAVVVTPARVTFRDYSGSFGEAGSPVIFEAAAPHNLNYLELKGSGKFFINTDADVTIVDAVVAITRRIASQCVLEGGAWTNLYALMGSMTLSGTVTNVFQEYLTNPRANTSVVVSSGAVIANYRQLGGRSTMNATLTGDLFLANGANMTYDVGNIDGLTYIHDGARLVFNSAGGDIDEVEVFNRGVLDFTQSQDARSIGVTCIVHAGGLIDAQGVDELITITPTIKQIGAGANVLPANLGTRLVLQPSSRGPSIN